MVTLSPGNQILAELRSRRPLACGPLALGDYEDLEEAVHSALPPGVSRAGPSDQVATTQDVLGYFKTAPRHEQKIAVMRIHGYPDSHIAKSLGMSPQVFNAVSRQMLARFSAHRADKPGSGLNVSPKESTGVAKRDLAMANEPPPSPGHAILAELRARRGQ
jgi:hypothetical protein